jgi:hypothetical protein
MTFMLRCKHERALPKHVVVQNDMIELTREGVMCGVHGALGAQTALSEDDGSE